ncbi:glycoside-pentoside-hexuronide (GPH):cation symporter [Oenococcus kitaharae]|uniref:Lactose and galactose permeaseGPH translocator family n=1 Tax=Oenococcus kitaharae DSM 17330 TaxID=1045004 RepID=G9WEW2_9LACO|nr:glycoside-pentoside-hexuronide (GPH):cation symporter [Oenococcus kitaharae]EHN58285.1 Lactose and galactose permeaseGPH translocator family [Oenococcus kitaharae DSM 17330]OEY81537.1 PTS sugar transporter subunit IIA [Oenococcus kitaharae]OEY83024.1 PTS sugar transporter subunit IIA [Oenococcus kitaharae]OEY84431.1 PTS sugar transporter subunit IIA [Oenococcus kitaharae]
MEKTKKTVTSRLSYSFGAFGHDMFYATLSTYFIMFVTSHLFDKESGASGARMIGYITLIIMVLRFIELAIDPFIGNTIDNTTTRWGKFKPWVVVGGTVGSIALTLLFTNLGGLNISNPILYLIIFAVLYITMDVFYSFKDIGFWSMIPALSFDSREREKTATFARVGSTIGQNIVGVIVMPIVLFFSLSSNNGQGDNRGWFAFALIIGLISWISAIAVGLGTKEIDSDLRKNKEKTSLKDVLHVLTRNDQLMWLSLSYAFYATGIQITNALELYYFTYILGNASQFSILATLNTFIGLLAVLLFPPLAQKFNRRNVFFISIAVLVVGIAVFTMAGNSLLLVLIGAELFFIPQPLVFLVVLMTITDSVEYGQLKFGHRDESLTLSVRPLLDKLGGAISNGVVGITAVWAGMTAGASSHTVTGQGSTIFKIMMFGLPLLLVVIATIVFFKKVTLDEKAHAKIVDQLEKSWGKNFSDSKENARIPVAALKEGEFAYYAPISGELVPLKDVSDPTFASGSMGEGFAIKPNDGRVYAPFDGIIRTTFSTRHAVGMVSDDGIASLIHIGVGTVNMRGTGFINYFESGQHVKRGDLLIEFWDPAIQKAGFDDTVIVVITNSNSLSHFELVKSSGQVTKDDLILKLTKK